LRDAIRRDVEQAVTTLAFAERMYQKLDTQRRLFMDFPRVMEQVRSGALERVGAALSRLYEGGQGFDLQRFLRDLPMALAQLAAAEKKTASEPPHPPATEPSTAAATEPPAAPATEAPAAEARPASEPPPAEAAAKPEEKPAEAAAKPEEKPAEAPDGAQPVSPRLELRAKLLVAAPQLAKAAQSYRRNVATVKRAAQPRRSPGPWRADREVLEEARRAVEFVQKLYDAYAEAWADQPLAPNLDEATAGEVDRFLAWTQLDRYVELAVLASTNAPRPSKPGQHVVGAPRESAPPPQPPPPVTEASPGAGGTTGPEREPTPTAAPPASNQPVESPEPGRA
jgi:hypothetical protein